MVAMNNHESRNEHTCDAEAPIVSANRKARTYRKRTTGATTVDVDMANRRAVIYVRISKNRDNETSTESQEAIARAWCEQHGIFVVAVYVDAGESAYAGKAPRPSFRKALDAIQSRTANTLVVYKLDRFMRDASTAVNVRDEIHAWGGSVVSATEGVDTADNSGGTASLIFGILSWLAEMESATKSDRMKDWHVGRYTHKQGALPPGGPRPFGYKRTRITLDDESIVSSLVIVEDEARIIHTAARMILDDGMGLQGVALALSTPARKISRTGLKHILTSETTAGLRYDGTTHHVGNWAAILDKETWEALALRLNDPKRLTAGPRGERRHLMSGLMTCGVCDHVMRMRTHDKGPRYACTSRTCFNSIMATHADAAVRDFLASVLDRKAWDTMRNAGRGFDPSVIAGYQSRLATLTAMFAAGDMEEAEYKSGRDIIRTQLIKAQESEFVALPEVDDVIADWDSIPLEGKRLVIAAIVDTIHVDAWVRGEAPESRIRIMRHKQN